MGEYAFGHHPCIGPRAGATTDLLQPLPDLLQVGYPEVQRVVAEVLVAERIPDQLAGPVPLHEAYSP